MYYKIVGKDRNGTLINFPKNENIVEADSSVEAIDIFVKRMTDKILKESLFPIEDYEEFKSWKIRARKLQKEERYFYEKNNCNS